MSYDLLNGKRIYQLDLQATLASDLKFAVDNEGFDEARYITLGQLSTLVGHPALSLGTPNGLSLITGTQILSLELANTSHAGAIPTLPNDATKYLNGVGAWTVPAGGSSTPITVTDGIFNLDITDDVLTIAPYAAKLVADPGYAYFYTSVSANPTFLNKLKVDGILGVTQLNASIVSTTLAGVVGYSSGYIGVYGWSASGLGVKAQVQTSTGTGIKEALRISRDTFGTPTNDWGVYISASIQDSAGYDVESSRIITKQTSVTHSSVTSMLEWWLSNTGTLAKKMELNGVGLLTVSSLNLSSGTVNKYLYLDSNHNVTYVDAVGGGDYILPVSTASVLGGVKIGSGVSVSVDGTISVSTSYEAPLVTGTTLQYYRGDKSWQTLNTTAVVEGTNLYFTTARARTSISLTTSGTSGAATYNSTTGVINIPNYATGGINLASLSATSPLSYNNTTGVFSISQATTSTNGYLSYTDWNTFNNKVSFPGFGTTHTTAAYGDHTHSGFVTSVGLSVPTGFTVSNTPITSAGTIALGFTLGYSLPTNTAQTNWNTAYSWGNHAGLYDKYTSWLLTANRENIAVTGINSAIGAKGLELIAGTNITITGIMNVAGQMALTINSTASGSSGVTSVGLALPTSVFTITVSPITTTGNLTATFNSQNAGKVFAAPSTSDGIPSFRALDINHLPTGITSTTVALGNHTHSYQPLDSDLTAIAALTAIGGYAYRSATGVWAIQAVTGGGNGFDLQYPGGTFPVTDGGYLNINTVTDGNITIAALPLSKRINISTPNSVQSSDITKVKLMTVLTEAQYAALGTKVATTMYIIVG